MELLFKIIDCYDYIGGVYLFLYFILSKNPKNYVKGIALIFAIDYFTTFQNYIFDLNFSYWILLENIFISFLLICKLLSNIKSDKINKKNVCIVFYNPRTLQQYFWSLFGVNVCSTALVIGKNIYRIVKDKPTLYKQTYTLDYIYTNYLVVDTGFPISELKGDWKKELLSQKARQPKTLWLRLNCLRSLRFVLNQIDNFKYQGEILPCIYLLKLKIKGVIQ